MPDPVGQIPPPDVVRHRLAENLREARVLRSLLRVSEIARRLQADDKQDR